MTSQLRHGPSDADRDQPDAEFVRFYQEYFPRLVAHLRLRLHAPDPEDVAQETLVRVFQRWGSVDRTRDPWPLLYVIARNLLADAHRREKTGRAAEVAAVHSADPPVQSPEDVMLGGERARLVHDAMAALRPADRRVLRLKLLRGLSCAEIAELSGGSAVSVRQRLFRARQRMIVQVERLSGLHIPAAGMALLWIRHLRRQLTAVPMAASAAVLAVGVGTLGPGAPVSGPHPVAEPPAVAEPAPGVAPAIGAAATEKHSARPDSGPAERRPAGENPGDAPAEEPGSAAPPSQPVVPVLPSDPQALVADAVPETVPVAPAVEPGPMPSGEVTVRSVPVRGNGPVPSGEDALDLVDREKPRLTS